MNWDSDLRKKFYVLVEEYEHLISELEKKEVGLG